MKTSRQLAFDTLLGVFRDGAYSNIAFDRSARESGLDREQTAFAAALVYGVLERSIGLDYAIEKYLKKGIASLDVEILVILRMGFYQLVYMNSVPDRAAVDESVRLVSYARKTSAKGFVNAVLRSFLRDEKRLALPEGDRLDRLGAAYSCPRWLLAQWEEQYGEEIAEGLAAAALERPPLTVRVNTLRTTRDALVASLGESGVSARPHELLEDCLILEGSGSLERLPQHREGLFHVQDAASQLCVLALDPQPGCRLLDLCAAPGSKSFTAAERMENRGEICAFDLHEHKLRLIEEGAERLGIDILHTALRDGAAPAGPEPAPADRVLCDVPCSGFGVIRRKPEIKYREERSFAGLPEIQLAILSRAASLLKPGGKLVYSTCTTNRRENGDVVRTFLSQNNSFYPLQLPPVFSKIGGMDDFGDGSAATLLPYLTGTDGFYVALLGRRD